MRRDELMLLRPGRSRRRAVRRVTVSEYARAIRYRSGRVAGVLGAGRYRVTQRVTITVLDMRSRILTVPGQEVLASDGVPLKVTAAMTVRVIDPLKAVLSAESYEHALYLAGQIALREEIAAMSIDELLRGRAALSERVLAGVRDAAAEVGCVVEALDVKDVMVPHELKRAYSAVVRVRQEGIAALERARGESAALRNLANAARLVEAHPALGQIRLLQQLESHPQATIVLGLPALPSP